MLKLPKRQAEALSRAISVDFDEYYASRPVRKASGQGDEARACERRREFHINLAV